MIKKSSLGVLLAVVLLLVLVSAGLAAGHAFAPTLDRWVVANGGGSSAAEGFSLNGTLAQPAANPPMTGGSFSLTGGYWGTGELHVFLPVLQR